MEEGEKVSITSGIQIRVAIDFRSLLDADLFLLSSSILKIQSIVTQVSAIIRINR